LAGAAIADLVPEVFMWKTLLVVPAILLAGQFQARAATVPPGTQIQVRTNAPIDVSRWDRGRIYPAHVAQDVFSLDGRLVIHRGSPAELIIRQVGPGQLALDLESVTSEGQRYVVDTSGPQYNMDHAEYNNGSGVLGAIAGAIAGANGEQVVGRGEHIHVPDGSMITFNLQEPLHVATWGDPGYDREGMHYHHDNDWYR
jgi:hypothetical protein